MTTAQIIVTMSAMCIQEVTTVMGIVDILCTMAIMALVGIMRTMATIRIMALIGIVYKMREITAMMIMTTMGIMTIGDEESGCDGYSACNRSP